MNTPISPQGGQAFKRLSATSSRYTCVASSTSPAVCRQLAASLDVARPLGDGLLEFYEASIDVYLRGGEHPRGCLVVCTAAAEANEQPEIREALASILATIDSAFRVRFEAAVDLLPLDGRPDAKQLAAIAGAILHSLALRARAGEDRASLTALARSATRMLETMIAEPGRAPPAAG